MERNLRHNEDVVRLFTVRVDALEEGQSVMMQQSRAREEGVPELEVSIADIEIPEIIVE